MTRTGFGHRGFSFNFRTHSVHTVIAWGFCCKNETRYIASLTLLPGEAASCVGAIAAAKSGE